MFGSVRQMKLNDQSQPTLERMVRRIDELEVRISRLEKPIGYHCQLCGIKRPANWFIYEVEKTVDNWAAPCCAECARKGRSRGPFPPDHVSHSLASREMAWLEAYQKCVNEIDDHFEYADKSKEGRAFVQGCLKRLTEKLKNPPNDQALRQRA